MYLLQYIREGGFAMYPLILCSIIIWAIIIERIWFYIRIHGQYRKVSSEILNSTLSKEKIHELKGLSKGLYPAISLPIEVLFENQDLEKNELFDLLSRSLLNTNYALKRFLWALATITTIAPFLGLLGTVLGIMRSFNDMSESGKSGFSVIAAGLSESLITTAVGIFLAVIAVIFYNYFQILASRISFCFKRNLEDIYSKISQSKEF